MSKNQQIRTKKGFYMYENFAYVYDEMMHDVDYEKWADYIEAIFHNFKIEPQEVVDLACGTGNITLILKKRGYSILGIDRSQDMLSVAQEKAFEEGFGIPFVCQDIRRINLHKKVDAIIVVCDGINYILKDQDLYKVFSGINKFLKPGGLLAFDLSSYHKLSSILGNNVITDDDMDISLIWQNRFNTQKDICEMNLTFFIREHNLYRRFDEIHKQRAYRIENIVEKLEDTGFRDICCYDHMTFDKAKDKSERWTFVAKKESGGGNNNL